MERVTILQGLLLKKYKGNRTVRDIKWFANRLKAMNLAEIAWRVEQKVLQKKEQKMLFAAHKAVTEIGITTELENLKADPDRLCLNLENTEYSLFEKLDLFGLYSYEDYKNKWNAGFQTDNSWPLDEFTYNISISQREDIGDIRTNWELNRHFQFVGLAKNYYITDHIEYLEELKNLFCDWNKQNKFLHGVQWTSAMEISIRIVSWSYMYAFLAKSQCEEAFLIEIEHGIKTMADYVLKHRARYTSANNHLIVEMLGVGIAGLLFAHDEWITEAVKILTEELSKQNYGDGVNKEMSLHYQAFVMEAYGIMWINMKRNKRVVPSIWRECLCKMSRFIADCCGDYGEVVEFGDSDEGKLIDFVGNTKDYYRYVLQLMGCLLDNRYTSLELSEDIRWLVSSKEIEKYRKKELYVPNLACSYKVGGYTILRSNDRRVLIGFDHADLGFGTIAAHGHADVLSIQIFFDGNPILLDTGTYNYHVPKRVRDDIRSTKAHNSVYVKGYEQAEMLGPFLWGKRYKMEDYKFSHHNGVKIEAVCSYSGIKHKRIIEFDENRILNVKDVFDKKIIGYQMWHLPYQEYSLKRSSVEGKNFLLTSGGVHTYNDCVYSDRYNHYKRGLCTASMFKSTSVNTIIKIEDK